VGIELSGPSRAPQALLTIPKVSSRTGARWFDGPDEDRSGSALWSSRRSSRPSGTR